MAEIIPRWEWRSFGRRFGDAESKLAKITPSGVQDSDEIYLLSGAGGNVKIRDALVDIKVKREVNAEGLEQWTPVMKAGFPLPAIEVAKVQQALDVPIIGATTQQLHTRRIASTPCRAGQQGSRGEGPQATNTLHSRQLHGRTF